MTGVMSGRLGATVAVWGATTLLVAIYAAASWWRSRRLSPPTKWRQVGVLSELMVYPLKSGKATILQEAECTELGVVTSHQAIRDRTFIIFNESNGSFMTGRQIPPMVLITTRPEGKDKVKLEAPGMSPLTFPVPDADTGEKRTCVLRRDETVEVLDCGTEAATWMSRYLLKSESGMRLGYHVSDKSQRLASSPPWGKHQKAFSRLADQDMGAFSDMTSYMLMTESSVEVLADKLPNHGVTARQFRPNFVVRGSEPFDEDSWGWVKIGENVVLKTASPCPRCILTTVDPETGIMASDGQPLKTLKTFRQLTGKYEREAVGDSPALGLHMGLYSTGKVAVGDPVYAA